MASNVSAETNAVFSGNPRLYRSGALVDIQVIS